MSEHRDLLFGPYKAPRVKIGQIVEDRIRGKVIVCGFTAGRIQWPLGKRGARTRARFLILMGDLVKAVKKEAPVALYFWWGVKASAVTRWRRALGVELSNPGTRILREAIGYDPRVVQGLKKAHAKANDPVRRAKISVANKGRKVSDKVRKRLSELRTGTKLSAETRRKIGETYRKRGHLPVWVTNPWTPEEDELVRALDPDEVAKRTGRPLRRVHARRYFLGVTRERGYNGTQK